MNALHKRAFIVSENVHAYVRFTEERWNNPGLSKFANVTNGAGLSKFARLCFNATVEKMQRIEGEEEYSALRELCEGRLPRAVVLLNILSVRTTTNIRKLANRPLEIFVDSWPNPVVVVVRSKPKWGNFADYPIVCAFSLDGNFEKATAAKIVRLIFRDTCLVYNGFTLNCWPLGEVSALRETIKQMIEENLDVEIFGSTRMFWIPPLNYDKLHSTEPVLPEGFYFGELLPEEAELVDSFWAHRFDGSIDRVRQFIITMPNVCVRSQEGKLAGFSMVDDFMGNEVHLYTLPEFRGRKIAFSIELILARKMLQNNLVPCKYVVPANYEAMQMTSKSPFWKEINEEFAWLQIRRSLN